MTKKILWTAAIFIFVTFLSLWNFFIETFDPTDFSSVVSFLSIFITVVLFSSVLAFLFALIPWRGKKYWARFGFTLPICLALVCLVLSVSFFVLSSNYSSIKTPAGTDCSSVHNGTFSSHDMIIERLDAEQTETMNNEVTHFRVQWLNDCEYELISDKELKKVKIVYVDEKGYDCYVNSRGITVGPIRVDKIRK